MQGKLSLNRFVERTSSTPAKLFGLFPKKGTITEGSDADVVLFDPAASQTITARDLHGNCDYPLLEGRTLFVDRPQWLGREGIGRFVPRGEVRAF